jgi:hypothetical protein
MTPALTDGAAWKMSWRTRPANWPPTALAPRRIAHGE